jgi:hypothetical protein
MELPIRGDRIVYSGLHGWGAAVACRPGHHQQQTDIRPAALVQCRPQSLLARWCCPLEAAPAGKARWRSHRHGWVVPVGL